MRLAGLSTGAFKNFDWSMDRVLSVARGLRLQAVELLYASPLDLFDSSLSAKSVAYLRSLSHVSIHAPFQHEYRNDALTWRVVKELQSIGELVGVDHYTLHNNKLYYAPVVEALEGVALVSVENLEQERGLWIPDFEAFFSVHPRAGFVLDTTHCFTYDPPVLDELLSWLGEKKRLRQVHVSGYNQGTHKPLHEHPGLLDSLEGLSVPLILEPMYDRGDLESLERDVTLLKRAI